MENIIETETGKKKSLKQNIKSFLTLKQFELIAFIILLTGILLRFNNINLFNNLSESEFSLVQNAGDIIRNGWEIKQTLIPNSLYLYFLAAIGYVTNFNILALRIFQVILSSLVLILFYYFVKNWYNRQTAIFAGLFFSINSFLVVNSQLINSKVLILLFAFLSFFTISIAFRRKNKLLFAISGIIIGLGLYTDEVFLFIYALSLVLFLLMIKKNLKVLTVYLYEIIIFVISFFVTATPYLLNLPEFIQGTISKFNPGSIGDFYLNIGETVPALLYRSPTTTIFNLGNEPLVDPFLAISFLCGIIFAAFHLNKRKHVFLIAWLFLGFITLGLLDSTELLNFFIIFPAVIVLASIIFDYILTNWSRTFPFNRQARISMALIFSVFLFMSFLYNYKYQFLAWKKDETIKNQFNQEYIFIK